MNKESASTPRYSSPQPTTFSASPFSSQQVGQSHPMSYDPSHSPSVVDNLALGIRNLVVEDDASLSQQTPPYRNGNHVSSGAPSTLPHIRAAPLQPRGHYTSFPPEYAPYYPGTPTGQRHRRLPFPFLITSVRPVRVRIVSSHSKCITGKLVSTSGFVFPCYIRLLMRTFSMACSTTMRDHQDPQVLSSTIRPNQHYTILGIHHYSHPIWPSTYLQ